ncbi:MAG: hypothetical protein RLZZ584_2048 [Pseudomonadota bacterium]
MATHRARAAGRDGGEHRRGRHAGLACYLLQMSWFKSLFGPSRFDTLADTLATELTRRYPPAMANGEGRKLSPQAVSNIVEGVLNKAVSKTQEWRLGVIGKARMGNALRWALEERGYPKPFVELVVEALIVYVTRNAGQARA